MMILIPLELQGEVRFSGALVEAVVDRDLPTVLTNMLAEQVVPQVLIRGVVVAQEEPLEAMELLALQEEQQIILLVNAVMAAGAVAQVLVRA
jgi:hypothetical protein